LKKNCEDKPYENFRSEMIKMHKCIGTLRMNSALVCLDNDSELGIKMARKVQKC
jgi:hypothetical protein